MLSDMFNHALKNRIDGLCSELATLVKQQPDLIHSGSFQTQRQNGGHEQRQDSYSHRQAQDEAGPVSLFIAPSGGSSGDWWGADLR